jgi:hypothetical protein
MLKLDVLSAELNLWANETEQIYRATREMQYRRNATHLRYLAATLNQSSILAGVTSFNTRTGDVTLLSADVVSALGYTPVTQARTLTINGLTQDLSANRSWTISTATPTLAQVTTAGNTTTNTITVGGFTSNASSTIVGAAAGTIGTRVLTIEGSHPEIWFKDTFVGEPSFALSQYGSAFYFARTSSTGVFTSYAGAIVGARWSFGHGGNPTATVHIKGSDVLSSTKALLVQNSSPTDLLTIWNDGAVGINTSTNAGYKLDVNGNTAVRGILYVTDTVGTLRAALQGFDNNEIQLSASRWVNSSTATLDVSGLNINTSFYAPITGAYGVSAGNNNISMQPGRYGFIGRLFATSSALGGGETWAIRANADVNITDGTTSAGTVYGVLIQPTLGTLNNVTYVALRSTVGNVQLNTTSGNTLIGTTTDSGAKVTVAGSITAASLIARGVYFNNTLVAAANNDVLVGLDINPTFTNGAFTGVTNLALRVQGNTEISRSGADTQLTIARGGGASLILQAKANSTSSSEGVNLYWTANTWLKFVLGSSVVANFSNVGNLLVGTSTDAGYKLDVNGSTRVKGAGTTSATTALLVQNSALSQLLKVTDDGQCQIGGNGLTTFPLQVYGNSGLQIQVGNTFFSYDVVRTIRFINPNNGIPLNHEIVNQVSSTDNSNYVYFRNQTIQTAGSTAPWKGISIETSVNTQTSAIVTQLSITPTLNLQANTTSASIQRGIYYNPTITTLQTAIHRAIETTSGDVIFNGGNLTVDTNTLFVDATNDRVGIGTTSPLYTLDAIGANFRFSRTSTVDFDIANTGLGRILRLSAGTSDIVIQNLGSYDIGFSNNFSRVMTLKPTGNVLIGTTTDAGNKLEVSGSINATDYKVGNVAGWNGIINIPTMPPVMITVTNGIITNVM